MTDVEFNQCSSILHTFGTWTRKTFVNRAQQALRRFSFVVDRISTKENPAHLNTKPFSKERREFLMKRTGLVSNTFEDEDENLFHGNKKKLVKLLVNLVIAGGLQGCAGGTAAGTKSTDACEEDVFRPTRRMLYMTVVVILIMAIVMARMFWKLNLKMEEVQNYMTLNSITEVMRWTNRGEVPRRDGSGMMQKKKTTKFIQTQHSHKEMKKLLPNLQQLCMDDVQETWKWKWCDSLFFNMRVNMVLQKMVEIILEKIYELIQMMELKEMNPLGGVGVAQTEVLKVPTVYDGSQRPR